MLYSEIKLAFKKLTFKKIMNVLKIYASFYFSSIFKTANRKGYPISLSVEPVSICNLRCPQCPTGRNELKRMKGEIDFSLYKKAIDECSPYLLNLFLYFQGEPFLHKEIFTLINYASKEKTIFTAASTNGHYLSEEYAEKIIQSGLDKLIISIDGTDQKTYEIYRKNGRLDKVTKGIQTLVRKKKELSSKTPLVEIQFLVFKFNEHQIKDIKTLSQQLKVDSLQIKSAQIYDFRNHTELIPDTEKYSRYRKDKNGRYHIKSRLRNNCKRMWESAVITNTGEVLHCCFDKDADYSYGNIKNKNFKKLNNSRKATDFRKMLYKNRKEIDICKNCTEGLFK